MTHAEAALTAPAHVRVVLEALAAMNANPWRVDEETGENPLWCLSWSPGVGQYVEIEVVPDGGVLWFAKGNNGTEDYAGISEREAGPVPDAVLPWLRRFGILA